MNPAGWSAAISGDQLAQAGVQGYCRPEDHVMTEVIFIVEEAPDRGYTAALWNSIYTEAESMESLEC